MEVQWSVSHSAPYNFGGKSLSTHLIIIIIIIILIIIIIKPTIKSLMMADPRLNVSVFQN
jgi:hypothetical protein